MSTLTGKLRRMTNLAADDATYTDAVLIEYMEQYPVADENLREPDHSLWIGTYDLHAAASEIWSEKLAALESSAFDFTADGATFNRSQLVTHMRNMISYHASRVTAQSATLRTLNAVTSDIPIWIFNASDEVLEP